MRVRVSIDERAVLARLDKAHHSHQPYNQLTPAPSIEPDTSQWFDAHTTLHPADVALAAGDDLRDQLPSYAPPVWTSTLAPPLSEFSLGVLDFSGFAKLGSKGAAKISKNRFQINVKSI